MQHFPAYVVEFIEKACFYYEVIIKVSTQIETKLAPNATVAPQRSAKAAKSVKSSKASYLIFFSSWILLIATGVLGTMMYTEHLRTQLSTQLAAQTEQQLQAMQEQYQQQLEQLKTSVTADLSNLHTKVDSFNELLAFTKDSANSKTDNSNQLYTQLAEVKKKLDELKQNLDVLK